MAEYFQAFLQLCRERRKAIAITLAVLLMIAAFAMIPVPGYEPGFAPNYSVFHFVVRSWMAAAVFMQLLSMVFSKKPLSSLGTEAFFQRSVLLICLLMTGLMAYGAAYAGFRPPASQGSLAVVTVVLSYMAGSTIFMFSGFIIERYGTGAGFWTMICAWSLQGFSSLFHELAAVDGIGRLDELTGWAIWFTILLVILMVLSLCYRLNSKTSLFCWAWPMLVVLALSPLVWGPVQFLASYFSIPPLPLLDAVSGILLFFVILVCLPPQLPSIVRWLSVPVVAVFIASDYFSLQLIELPMPQLDPLTYVLVVSATTYIFFAVKERVLQNHHAKIIKFH